MFKLNVKVDTLTINFIIISLVNMDNQKIMYAYIYNNMKCHSWREKLILVYVKISYFLFISRNYIISLSTLQCNDYINFIIHGFPNNKINMYGNIFYLYKTLLTRNIYSCMADLIFWIHDLEGTKKYESR